MKLRRSTKLLLPLLICCVAIWIISHFYFGRLGIGPSRSLRVDAFIERGMVGICIVCTDIAGGRFATADLHPIEENVRFVVPEAHYGDFGSAITGSISAAGESSEYAWYCPFWFVSALVLALLLILEFRSRRRARAVNQP